MIAPPFDPDTPLPCSLRPSPNHGERHGRRIDAIVLHYTGMSSAEAALARLCDRASEVSSHYLIDESGGLVQLVPEERRAWHAGRSYWRGERDLNSVSIGIEIANAGHDGGLPAFPEAQIEILIALCRDIMGRQGIAPNRVLGHSDIAPNRKVDPGERFPWAQLALSDVGTWPGGSTVFWPMTVAAGAVGSRIATLQDLLALWGTETPSTAVFDDTTRAAVAAFQLHFRPSLVDGVADTETVRRLHAVATLSQQARNISEPD